MKEDTPSSYGQGDIVKGADGRYGVVLDTDAVKASDADEQEPGKQFLHIGWFAGISGHHAEHVTGV
jgi:hypothetical protein